MARTTKTLVALLVSCAALASASGRKLQEGGSYPYAGIVSVGSTTTAQVTICMDDYSWISTPDNQVIAFVCKLPDVDDNQKWAQDGIGEIVNYFTGLCITLGTVYDSAGDTLLVSEPCTGAANQMWTFTPQSTISGKPFQIALTSTLANKDKTKVLCLQVRATSPSVFLGQGAGLIASTCVTKANTLAQSRGQTYPKATQFWSGTSLRAN